MPSELVTTSANGGTVNASGSDRQSLDAATQRLITQLRAENAALAQALAAAQQGRAVELSELHAMSGQLALERTAVQESLASQEQLQHRCVCDLMTWYIYMQHLQCALSLPRTRLPAVPRACLAYMHASRATKLALVQWSVLTLTQNQHLHGMLTCAGTNLTVCVSNRICRCEEAEAQLELSEQQAAVSTAALQAALGHERLESKRQAGLKAYQLQAMLAQQDWQRQQQFATHLESAVAARLAQEHGIGVSAVKA